MSCHATSQECQEFVAAGCTLPEICTSFGLRSKLSRLPGFMSNACLAYKMDGCVISKVITPRDISGWTAWVQESASFLDPFQVPLHDACRGTEIKGRMRHIEPAGASVCMG